MAARTTRTRSGRTRFPEAEAHLDRALDALKDYQRDFCPGTLYAHAGQVRRMIREIKGFQREHRAGWID